ncbi:MAG: GNAT family N-acetyltransferase [Pseudomonadota bacterium]|nr:GNAT family N-acetyltransferase [Pseudomonadota bacterium]
MHIFPVETDRLSMRPLDSEAAALYTHLYSDAETMRFIGAPLSPEQAAKSFRKALAGMQRQPIEQLFLTVMERQTRTDVGICSLQNLDAGQRSVQAGVMFIAAARARGYSKESFIGLIQQVFAQLPVDELWVQFALDHVAVQRAVLSVGFARRKVTAADDRSEPGAQSNESATAWSVRRATWSPPSAPRNVR